MRTLVATIGLVLCLVGAFQYSKDENWAGLATGIFVLAWVAFSKNDNL